MTTITATSNTQQCNSMYDPYGGMFKPSMANDFLGQQIFGNSGMFPQSVPVQMNSQPRNIASAILQQYKIANGCATGSNYLQNYYTASMIANQMSQMGNILYSPSSDFVKNDIFASQIFGPGGRGLGYIA